MKLHFPAVAAFETCRNIAFIRQSATPAKRRFDIAHTLRAIPADVAFGCRRRFALTELTNGRVEKAQAGIKPAFQTACEPRRIHGARRFSCSGSGWSLLRKRWFCIF